MLALWIRMQNWLRRMEGQALSEYGIIIAVVVVAAITALVAFRNELSNVLNELVEGLKNRKTTGTGP